MTAMLLNEPCCRATPHLGHASVVINPKMPAMTTTLVCPGWVGWCREEDCKKDRDHDGDHDVEPA